jgi:uncharacterized protein (TIRG00374 family)
MKKTLKVLLFISIGLILLFLVYKDFDFSSISKQLASVNYLWLTAALFFVVLSHLSRSIRWQIMMKSIDYDVKGVNAFFSVIISYFASLAIPRAGEIARCVYIKNYEKVPVSTTLGTVVSERVVDMSITLLATLTVALTSYQYFIDFFQSYLNIPISLSLIIYIVLSGTLSVLLMYIFRSKIKTFKLYKKVEHIVYDFKDGLVTILKFKNKYLFLFLSFLIWFSYYMTFYCGTQCFEFTRNFGMFNAFIAFVLATYGVLVPTPGGIGAYHFIVIVTLPTLMPTIQKSDAEFFALFAHSVPNLLIVLLGFASMVVSPLINKE